MASTRHLVRLLPAAYPSYRNSPASSAPQFSCRPRVGSKIAAIKPPMSGSTASEPMGAYGCRQSSTAPRCAPKA